MVMIKRLKKPSKRSGFKLEPQNETRVRGMSIINLNKFPVYIDKFTPKKKRRK